MLALVFVVARQIFNNVHDKVLVHNNHTTDVDKYRVNYPYGLDILGLEVDDEAIYQCEINDVGARTNLKVLGRACVCVCVCVCVCASQKPTYARTPPGGYAYQ